MSANLVVDLGGTTLYAPSLHGPEAGNTSGQWCGLSGQAVGTSVDLINANTFCNVYVDAYPVNTSGNLLISVQVSDTDVSGLYSDPTSGVLQFPTSFVSGGVLWLNSGSTGGILSSGGASGTYFASGFTQLAGFQRTQRYARLLFNSGFFLGNLAAGFISQLKTTGSGGGFSYSPSSGSVNV